MDQVAEVGSSPGGTGLSRTTHVMVVSPAIAAAIRAGIFRDPFPEFVRLNPGWTRERWDRAMG